MSATQLKTDIYADHVRLFEFLDVSSPIHVHSSSTHTPSKPRTRPTASAGRCPCQSQQVLVIPAGDSRQQVHPGCAYLRGDHVSGGVVLKGLRVVHALCAAIDSSLLDSLNHMGDAG